MENITVPILISVTGVQRTEHALRGSDDTTGLICFSQAKCEQPVLMHCRYKHTRDEWGKSCWLYMAEWKYPFLPRLQLLVCLHIKVSQTAPPNSDKLLAAAAGDRERLGLSLQRDVAPLDPDRQGLTALHVACLHGQLACIELLVDTWLVEIDTRGPQGRRPVHMLLSPQSSPRSSACLAYLLERGADITVTTDAGQTPLHLAAAEGLLDCVEILVQAGADVFARDCMGHTALDLARIWCHRKVARYLKNCMWQADKKKEMEGRKLVQTLYQDLVDMAKLNDHKKQMLIEEKMAEWANKKGLPVLQDFSPRVLLSQYHTQCLLSQQDSSSPKQAKAQRKPQTGGPRADWNISANPTKPPPASVSRLQTVRMGGEPEKPPREPDLRNSVTLRRSSSGKPQYITKWDGSPRAAPDLPLDVLQKVLFPKAFPSRIASPRHFQPQNVLDLPRLGRPQGQSSSPWTEVAMHLAEVLEPGHY
ncbi:ankyrin repeat domain 53 [Centroberyx gerrardi]